MAAKVIKLKRYVVEYVLKEDPYNTWVLGDYDDVRIYGLNSNQAGKQFKRMIGPGIELIEQMYVYDYYSYFLEFE